MPGPALKLWTLFVSTIVDIVIGNCTSKLRIRPFKNLKIRTFEDHGAIRVKLKARETYLNDSSTRLGMFNVYFRMFKS